MLVVYGAETPPAVARAAVSDAGGRLSLPQTQNS
jgi:hypothetical protein